jgi:hypothetical protein
MTGLVVLEGEFPTLGATTYRQKAGRTKSSLNQMTRPTTIKNNTTLHHGTWAAVNK